mmetsp:Transcript_3498/g.9749  ORF Transcript_3498/g.9749 Transcript_3498/m.9749 type:complete len:241 (+) Transcript_3498:282-1004(+)
MPGAQGPASPAVSALLVAPICSGVAARGWSAAHQCAHRSPLCPHWVRGTHVQTCRCRARMRALCRPEAASLCWADGRRCMRYSGCSAARKLTSRAPTHGSRCPTCAFRARRLQPRRSVVGCTRLADRRRNRHSAPWRSLTRAPSAGSRCPRAWAASASTRRPASSPTGCTSRVASTRRAQSFRASRRWTRARAGGPRSPTWPRRAPATRRLLFMVASTSRAGRRAATTACTTSWRCWSRR